MRQTPAHANRKLSGPKCCRFLLALTATGFTLGQLRAAAPQLIESKRTAKALGSAVAITVFHTSRKRGEAALDAAFAELENIESLLSIYRADSQVSELNRKGELHKPHPHFVAVLQHAQSLAKATDGAFDVTVQPLWELFSNAKKHGRTPTATEIKTAQTRINWRALELAKNKIHFKTKAMALTLNGIAQGYASDCVAAVLRQAGVQHALIDTGELNALDTKPNGARWKVGIQHPRNADAFLALAKLKGRCLATSGDYATPFTPDFKAHHIFDPRTGQSPAQLSSVSVAARTGIEADALSTAVFVLGPDHGLALIKKTDGADALLVLKNGKTLHTRNFPIAQK